MTLYIYIQLLLTSNRLYFTIRGWLQHSSCLMFLKSRILRRPVSFLIMQEHPADVTASPSIFCTAQIGKWTIVFPLRVVFSLGQKRRATPSSHLTIAHWDWGRGVKNLTISDPVLWKMDEIAFKCWGKTIKTTLSSNLFILCHSNNPMTWVACMVALYFCGDMKWSSF